MIAATIPAGGEQGLDLDAGPSKRSRGDPASAWQLKKFKENGGKLYMGTEDVEASVFWIRDTESTLIAMGCPTQYWTRMGVSALQCAARQWWDSIAPSQFTGLSLDMIPWQSFREQFHQRYIPAEACKVKELEFLNLKQGKETVAAYLNRFTTLMIYGSQYMPEESHRIKRFINGLVDPARQRLYHVRFPTFSEAVAAAFRDEMAYLTRDQSRRPHAEGSRRSGSGRRYHGQRATPQAAAVAVRAITGQEQQTRQTAPCHICGQLGHWARQWKNF